MKKPLKKFLRSPTGQTLVGGLVAALSKLCWATARVQVVLPEGQTQPPFSANMPGANGAIVALWHGRLLLMPFLFPRHLRRAGKVHALISAHTDGRLIALAARLFGIRSVEGSSSRGGAAAFRHLKHLAEQGNLLFITPDGPRGPRMHLAAGCSELSRQTGLPVLPVAISASHGPCVKSWDRFLIPRPFSRVCVVWGSPITVPQQANKQTREACRVVIETAMNQLQQQADQLCNRTETVLPQPTASTKNPA